MNASQSDSAVLQRTALERARSFVAKNVLTTALTIVPLAAAPSAQGAPVFGPGTASQTDPTDVMAAGIGGPMFEGLPEGGVKFYLTGNAAWSYASGGGSSKTVGLNLEGTGSGTLDAASIPAHFDFSAEIPNGTWTSWSIDFFINSANVGSRSGTPPDGPILDVMDDLLLSGWTVGAPLSTWGVELRGRFEAGDFNGQITMSVPDSSIAIAPGLAATVPEPATAILLATGTALLAVRRRRSSEASRK